MDSRRRRERFWSAQHRVAQVLASAESLEECADELLEIVAESDDWRLGLLWRTSDDGLLTLLRAWPVRSHANGDGVIARAPDDAGLAGRTLASRSPASATPPEPADQELIASVAPNAESGSSFAFPVEAESVLCVLAFYGEQRGPPDEPLLNTSRAIGSLMGQFLLRRQAELALREREEHFRLALASAETGTWELDLRTGREVWSEQLFHLYGLEPKKALPSYELWLSLLHPEDRGRLEAKTRRMPESGETSFYDEFRVLTRRKGQRWMLSRGQVFYDENGNGVSMRGTIVDITDRKVAEEQIQKLNRELEKRVRERTKDLATSNAELESFAYSVSHDLRAPLRGIDGFSQALLEDYGHLFDERAQEYLRRVRSGARRMGELIDDLLNLSRLSRRTIVRQEVDLSELAREITDRQSEEEPDRQVRVAIQPDVTCIGDAGLLRVVLENLLGNAWKFTRGRGDAFVEFGVADQNGERAFFVRDNGIGFDPRYADKLFGAFQRLHKRDEFEGSGIGLATVKRIVHRHLGQVWAEGAVESGATFYFTIGDRKD
jgi:PAS domain S-box-containing protein